MLFQQLNLNFIFTFHNVREFQGLFRFIRKGKGGCSVPFKKGGGDDQFHWEGREGRSVPLQNGTLNVLFRSRKKGVMFHYVRETRGKCSVTIKKEGRDASFRSRKDGGMFHSVRERRGVDDQKTSFLNPDRFTSWQSGIYSSILDF